MYEVEHNGSSVGKMNAEYLKRWLLKERTEIKADMIIADVDNYGRYKGRDGLLIRKLITKP